jgi:hypothetical protein
MDSNQKMEISLRELIARRSQSDDVSDTATVPNPPAVRATPELCESESIDMAPADSLASSSLVPVAGYVAAPPTERMRDYLSLAVSIAGLVGRSAAVLSSLYGLHKHSKDAPESLRRLIYEVQEMNSIFGRVQMFHMGTAKGDHDRLTMISVHHLEATLRGCVLVFSDLDTQIHEVAGITADSSVTENKASRVWERVNWSAWKESTIADVLEELHRHKVSINLMLGIIQW